MTADRSQLTVRDRRMSKWRARSVWSASGGYDRRAITRFSFHRSSGLVLASRVDLECVAALVMTGADEPVSPVIVAALDDFYLERRLANTGT
ncbi:hypothetical protein LMG24076_01313 [Trinickia soli]|nr:hypothetical protein LMG24076_01313 [Trinickia soli]